ncbi:Detected protein of confused Function [Hibiscus syriacus]|uniref:Detected protein of confused Function n=2 Tax=Hibiscus syriacus TaxID=106335 RepID=A0A6A3BK81_HIBSY|nr:Detected protein of confused Function [Hibiscus syriacus]
MAMALQEQEIASSMIESDDNKEYDTEASYKESNVNDYEYFEGLEVGDYLEFEDMEEDDDFEEEDDEIYPDDLSYEELISMGEIIGVEKRGLSPDEILPCLIRCKFRYVECKTEVDRCVICQTDYEEDEDVVALRNCDYPYHSDCISKWLRKKICPICTTEISSSKN